MTSRELRAKLKAGQPVFGYGLAAIGVFVDLGRWLGHWNA
ncbi:hypothetical protein WCLP8_1270001 [uncultured Gammaproteobacteria bacterium]